MAVFYIVELDRILARLFLSIDLHRSPITPNLQDLKNDLNIFNVKLEFLSEGEKKSLLIALYRFSPTFFLIACSLLL